LVVIEVQGVGTFLGESQITWQVDGKTVLSGIGERRFSFTVGSLGSQTSVSVTINSATKGVITKSFIFKPSTVTLLWEADTTVPLLYAGKALYSGGSGLKVVAIPQVIAAGATVSANNLSFQWERNGTPMTSLSGKGRSTLTLNGNQLLPEERVGVTVLLNDTTVARGSVIILASKPLLRIYELDPLRGMLTDRALSGQVSLAGKEVSVKAEPYFFANLGSTGPLSYEWTLNNKQATGPDTSRGILTLRQTGEGTGSASLFVSLQNTNPSQYVQSASAALSLLFGGSSGNSLSSFFGI
jgi:hypothetical protein